MKARQADSAKEFPHKLKELRQNNRWSQGQLAKKLDVDPQRISRYERGLITPTTEVIVKIASVFGVSLDYLLREEKDIAINKIKNLKLLERIEVIDTLPKEKQDMLVSILDAFITQQKLEDFVKSSGVSVSTE